MITSPCQRMLRPLQYGVRLAEVGLATRVAGVSVSPRGVTAVGKVPGTDGLP